MSLGAVNIQSGVFRITRWQPGFNPVNFKITTSQVWIRIHGLPLEFRKEQSVLNVAGGVGLPLKIDPLSLSLYHGRFSRVLVDVDLSQTLPEQILVKMEDADSNLDVSFFVQISYESLPKYYSTCQNFTHTTEDCSRSTNRWDTRKFAPSHRDNNNVRNDIVRGRNVADFGKAPVKENGNNSQQLNLMEEVEHRPADSREEGAHRSEMEEQPESPTANRKRPWQVNREKLRCKKNR